MDVALSTIQSISPVAKLLLWPTSRKEPFSKSIDNTKSGIESKPFCASTLKCKEFGGEILDGPSKIDSGDFCVIKDPSGTVLVLILI